MRRFSALLMLITLAACTGSTAETDLPVSLPEPEIVSSESAAPAEDMGVNIEGTPSPIDTALPSADYFSQSNPLSDNSFTIPLAVRHVTKYQATLFFELQNPADGMLVVRSLGSLQPQAEILFTSADKRQMITVGGLEPGEEYESLVLFCDHKSSCTQPGFAGKEWGSVRFKTADDEWPLRVAVLGDASFGDESTQALIQLISAQDLDFLVHTGDVVYEADSSDVFQSYTLKFFEPFAPILHQMPVYTVLGNHDYDSTVMWQGAPYYDLVFPPFPNSDDEHADNRRSNQYYAFSYQDIQFLMLDTHVFAGGSGREEQDTWLRERLSDPRYRLTIPVFHVASYSSSAVHPDDGLPVRYSWNQLFESANVPITLSGHFHHYERVLVNGISYIVTGGGSSTLYAQGDLVPGSQGYFRKTHFVLLEIFKDYIDLKAIDLGGEIIDSAVIEIE